MSQVALQENDGKKIQGRIKLDPLTCCAEVNHKINPHTQYSNSWEGIRPSLDQNAQMEL